MFFRNNGGDYKLQEQDPKPEKTDWLRVLYKVLTRTFTHCLQLKLGWFSAIPFLFWVVEIAKILKTNQDLWKSLKASISISRLGAFSKYCQLYSPFQTLSNIACMSGERWDGAVLLNGPTNWTKFKYKLPWCTSKHLASCGKQRAAPIYFYCRGGNTKFQPSIFYYESFLTSTLHPMSFQQRAVKAFVLSQKEKNMIIIIV